jgi:hypothetical protein
MEEIQQEPVPGNIQQRPNLLTVLCILTFIGSGLNLFSSLMISLFFETFKTVAGSVSKTLNLPGMDMILNANRMFFITSVLFYGASIAGAFLMFRMKKLGFHIYTTSQILLIISPMYFFKIAGPAIFDLLLSGIFVALYSIHLKLME